MQIEWDEDLVKALDFAAAARTEIDTPPDLLPARVVERAVDANIDSYVRKLSGTARGRLVLGAHEVIPARKATRGSRPVPVLSFNERVLLRALGSRLWQQLPAALGSPPRYEEMVQGPIVADAQWVVHADVAAFYQFVDHDLLSSEIVSTTGDSLLSDALGQLLGALMGRRFGLPQGHRSSDVFANLYIDIVERQMLRRGREVWRYNDDFRIAAASKADAELAIDQLEAELRQVGLALNDDKTFILSGARYSEWASEAEAQIAELASRLATDLTLWNPYTEQELAPGEEEVVVAAAAQALAQWAEEGRSLMGAHGLAARRLLSIALSILRSYEAPDAIDYCEAIVRREPGLTMQVSTYLSSLMSEHGRDSRGAIATIVSADGIYLSAWQRLWILDALMSSDRLTKRLTAWAHSLVHDPDEPGAVRASASRLLARHGHIDTAGLLSVLASVMPASRPEVVAALAAQGEEITSADRKAAISDFVDDLVFRAFEPEVEEPF